MLAVSFGLALVIWFLVTDAENEVVEQPLGFGLAVEAVNVPVDLATAGRIPPVSIIIAGRETELEEVSVDDFPASIDLAGLAVGTHEVPVRVESLDGDVRVRAVSPEAVVVVLEAVVERELPVTVVITNPPPLGFEVGAAELSAGTVRLVGVRQLVDLVDVVVAQIDLAAATVDVRLSVILQPRTGTGAAVTGVQLQPNFIDVRVPIQQAIFRRTVTVFPFLVGEPAAGFRVASVSVDPISIVVLGTLEALDPVTTAGTVSLSLRSRTTGFSAQLEVLPPSGLVLEEASVVTVRVEIVPIITVASFTALVQVTNLDPGLRALVTPAEVQIVLQGPASALAELDSTSVALTVSAEGAPAGTFSAAVQVGIGGDVEVLQVNPAAVQVVLVPLTESGG